MCDSVNQHSGLSSQQSAKAISNQQRQKAKAKTKTTAKAKTKTKTTAAARERHRDAFLTQGRCKRAKKIGACQSRADQQAPLEQRSLHTFISERLRGRHRIFQRVNPVTGCAF
jgi:hypothetical protein